MVETGLVMFTDVKQVLTMKNVVARQGFALIELPLSALPPGRLSSCLAVRGESRMKLSASSQ